MEDGTKGFSVQYYRVESFSSASNVKNPLYALYSRKMLFGTFPGSAPNIAN